MKGDREGDRLWRAVAATLRPLPGREPPPLGDDPPAAPSPARPSPRLSAPRRSAPPQSGRVRAPGFEPGRLRRLQRGRDPLHARLDLHGLTQAVARAELVAFAEAAHARGCRSLLVITGKGAGGDGVLRRRLPEWLAEPPLAAIVAGVALAHRRHGGEGALYIALKRRR